LAVATAHPTPSSVADMPAEPTQARRFGKAREARSATLTEDYVELIADLLLAHGEARATDVAKRLGVTHPTALKCIARLKREVTKLKAERDILKKAAAYFAKEST